MIANADMTEPYQWIPSNATEVSAFYNHVRGLTDQDATLTLTDDPPATDHTVDAGNVSWSFDVSRANRHPHTSPNRHGSLPSCAAHLGGGQRYTDNCYWSGPR